METCRLTLVYPPALAEPITLALLDREPALPAFTTLAVRGHGGSFVGASQRERVRGHASREALWMVLPRDGVEALLALLRERVPAHEVIWWTEPVTGFGRLA